MSLQDVYTIIPTGGEGKRLRPFTENRSKPLVPVINNFPILELVLYSLAYGAGLRKFVFGVKGTRHYVNLQNYFQGGSGWSGKLDLKPNAHFEYQNPNYLDTGSADSARYNLEKYKIASTVIICPSDNLFWGTDIKKLYEKTLKSPYLIGVGLAEVGDVRQYGVVDRFPRSVKVSKFKEKPGGKRKRSGTISTGIYVIKPEAYKYLNGDFGKDVLPELTSQGKVGGYMFDHCWHDFGNPTEHLKSVLSLLREPTPCFENFLSRVCTEYKDGKGRMWVRGRSTFSRSRTIDLIRKVEAGKIKIRGNVFIGKDSVIEDGVTLKDCAIGDLSYIGSNCEISGSNILDAWQISSDCKVRNSFLARGGTIQAGGVVENSFLGDNTAL